MPVKNYWKRFENIIFIRIYNLQLEEELLNANQSGFRPFINQLLVITHEIIEALDFDLPLDVRSVFLDYQKLLTSFGTKVCFIN